MTDFQSIYKCEDKILGYPGSDYESKTYKLLLRPSNTGAFNRQVTIIPDTKEEDDFNCISWEVEYDFTEESLETESEIMFTKGKIIYLKDHNNNSAPYDFYNIRFKNEDEYITTFEKCEIFYNNHFDIGCYNNVFKGNEVSNNTFKSNCYNNILFIWICTGYIHITSTILFNINICFLYIMGFICIFYWCNKQRFCKFS
jgi:hypothetical protein